MGGELLLARDEQREHVDESLHLGTCVGDLRHSGDREPDLVVGLQHAYGPVELQPAVSARACPKGMLGATAIDSRASRSCCRDKVFSTYWKIGHASASRPTSCGIWLCSIGRNRGPPAVCRPW